jgi:dethiobiotin synthetase
LCRWSPRAGIACGISLDKVLERLGAAERRCERLVIEGCGGLLVRLGEGYTVADLIVKLSCQIIATSR